MAKCLFRSALPKGVVTLTKGCLADTANTKSMLPITMALYPQPDGPSPAAPIKKSTRRSRSASQVPDNAS